TSTARNGTEGPGFLVMPPLRGNPMASNDVERPREALARQLAEARQLLAHEAGELTGASRPRWEGLTDQEREMAVIEARNWLRALYSLLDPSHQVAAVGGGKLARSKADLRLSYALEVRLVDQLERELPGGLAADQRQLIETAAAGLRNLAAFRDVVWAVRPA